MISIYFLDRITEEHDKKLLNEMKGVRTSNLTKSKDKNTNSHYTAPEGTQQLLKSDPSFRKTTTFKQAEDMNE